MHFYFQFCMIDIHKEQDRGEIISRQIQKQIQHVQYAKL